MTIQYINTGSSANAGNGDSLRSAFIKVNNNFSYLSTASFGGGGGGYTGSRGSTGTNGFTGSQGDIGFTGSIGYTGSSNINEGFQNRLAYYATTGTTLSSVPAITFTPATTSTFPVLQVGDATSSPIFSIVRNTYTANPIGGFFYSQHHENQDAANFTYTRTRGTSTTPTNVQNGDDIADILFGTFNSGTAIAAQVTVTVDGNLTTPGQVPAKYQIGVSDGTAFRFGAELSSSSTWKIDKLSHLSTTTSSIVVSTNLIPSEDLTYDLGSTSSQWRSLYVGTSTIYLGGVAVSIAGGNLTIDGNPVSASTATGYTGSVGATGYTGSASTSTGYTGSVGATGYTGSSGGAGSATTSTLVNGTSTITLSSNGNTTFPTGLTLGAPRGVNTVNFTCAVDKEFQIETGTTSTGKLWQFGTTGNTTFPGNLQLNGGKIILNTGGNAYVESVDYGVNTTTSAVNIFGGPYQKIKLRAGFGTEAYWTFGTDGTLTLPAGGTIIEGGGLTGAIKLTPAGGANAYQALLIYPTAAGDGDHLHLTAAGGTTELYLGDDSRYVKLVNGGNIEVRATTTSSSASAAWTFGTDGAISTTDPLIINVPNGVPTGVGAIASTTGSWEQNPAANLATTGGSGTGLRVSVTHTGGYASAIAITVAGTGYLDGELITVTSGGSSASFIIAVTGTINWTFGIDGNLTLPNGAVLRNLANSAIAFGQSAGANNSQGATAIAIGTDAGYYTQGAGAVAIGESAGESYQGANAVAIGKKAGYYYQAANSIILNATGDPLEQTTTSTFTVAPIRNASGTDGILQYNTTTKEVTYSTTITATASAGTTSTTAAALGYIGMPQNSTATSYTLVAGDQGKHIYISATGQTITIPANTAVAFPIGTTIAFIAGPSATTVTIAITTDTMYLGGTGTTGNRTLAAHGMATAVKVASTDWYINGTGLT
jgi:hypothetical protein